MAREVLIVGELNDGLEPQYPTTDVPRLSGKVEVLFGQELDRHMGDQLPGWTCFQGNADDPDNGDVGLGIRNGLMDITDVFWVNLATWKAGGGMAVLVVRADYLGCELSLMSTKRPAPGRADKWPIWNANFAKVVAAERKISRIPLCGMDANHSTPLDLTAATGMTWSAPWDTSVVGILSSVKIQTVATTFLNPSVTGEHPPVVSVLRVPIS
jgi:hypothetical protein